MQTHPFTGQAPRGARIPDADPERDLPREKPVARAERAVERKPAKTEEPAPAHHYGAGF